MVWLLFMVIGAPWIRQRDVDGVTVEARSVVGSSFEELRLTATSSRSVESLCLAVWGDGDLKSPEPGFKVRRILRQTENERWTYEQIAVPIVSDRDYTLHAERRRDGDGCRVVFETRNQDGPPPQPGLVRISRISGSWTLTPSPGGTRITYLIFSEPGGRIPAWMARGAERDNAVKWMRTILARGLKASAR